MTVRMRTLLIIGVTVIALISLLYVASSRIVLEDYARLEQADARQNVEGAVSALSNGALELGRIAESWSVRDDTYDFIRSSDPAYVQKNLGLSTFRGLDLSLVAFVDSAGRVVYSNAYDAQLDVSTSLPPGFTTWLGENLSTLQKTDQAHSGLVMLPSGPLWIGVGPILTGRGSGPSRGIVLVGRPIDAAALGRLSQSTQLTLALFPLSGDLPADVKSAAQALAPGLPVVWPLSSTALGGYALLDDLVGQPAAILRMQAPRDVYQQSQASLHSLLGVLMLLGLAFLLAGLLASERWVAHPIARLNETVSRLGASIGLSGRVHVAGKDEISHLTGAIERMLEEIQSSHRQQHESEERYRSAIEQVREGVAVVDAQNLRILEANSAFQKMFEVFSEDVEFLTLVSLIPRPEIFKAKLKQAIEDGKPMTADYSILGSGGNPVELEM